MNELIALSICDYVGIEKKFIRINDAIRDYVLRNRLSMPEEFRRILDEHLNSFLESEDVEERDVSETLYSIKEGIKAGRTIRDKYLIPSHFIESIRELYNEHRNLDRVIELADMLLEERASS